MPSLLRLLLICWIALALPAQGIAAATMQFCGPGHEPQARLLANAAHAHHGTPGQASHATAPAAEGASQSQAADMAPLGKMNCSACAACCMATALPASPLLLPVVELAVEHTVVRPATYVGPDRAGFERPPKHPLA